MVVAKNLKDKRANKAIEELFVLSAKVGMENIEVIIAPKDFRLDANFPEIYNLDWENELYNLVLESLQKYQEYTVR